MRDTISMGRIAQLHPKIRDEVKALIEQAEKKISPRLTIRIVQGLRTIEEQNELYAQGRTKPGPKVTNAKGGSSFHEYGLAFDFAFIVDSKVVSWDTIRDWDKDGVADWFEVIKIFTLGGYKSGATFSKLPDFPHIEKTFGNTWQQLYNKHNKKQFIPGTQYVQI